MKKKTFIIIYIYIVPNSIFVFIIIIIIIIIIIFILNIYSFRVYQINPEEKKTVFVFHHGAGLSGLSYALLADYLKGLNNNQCGILCYDCRGHGNY